MVYTAFHTVYTVLISSYNTSMTELETSIPWDARLS